MAETLATRANDEGATPLVSLIGSGRARVAWIAGFALAVALGVAVQVWAALQWSANADGDEAVIGLMALHVLKGQIPTYYYGQTYLGSLDAILSAAVMRLFGDGAVALRASSLILAGAFLLLHGRLVCLLWGRRVALLSLLVLALPGWRVLWWTYKPIVAFGAMAALGTAALLLMHRMLSSRDRPGRPWQGQARLVALGFVVGLGLWVHPMTLVYFATVGVVFWLGTPEWAALHQKVARSSFRMMLPLVALGAAGLLAVSLFTNGCVPQALYSTGQTISRVLLVGLGAGLALAAVRVSTRRRDLLAGALSVAAGLAIGNLPQWRAWLFFGVAPASGVVPTCLTEASGRAELVLRELVPAMWGLPSFQALRQLPPSQAGLWIVAMLLMLAALGAFVWRERRVWWPILALAPLPPPVGRAGGAAAVGLLFGIPVVLAVLGGNTLNVWAVRYLLIAWQASSVILAIFLSRVVSRSRLLGVAVVGFWVFQVGVANLVELDGIWSARRERFSTETVSELDAFLSQHSVAGGYADYYVAYTLSFLTEERLTFAPYNGGDRYPAYSEKAAALPVQAYVFWPSTIPPGIARADELARELRQHKLGTFGPAFPKVLDDLGRRVVLERRQVGEWDVWLVGDGHCD
ncbi:MAG: hypothetical protein HY331_02850 [Chloroflexi bacterium]|nr:hypothetical protein [Chloroflexota bacterium]